MINCYRVNTCKQLLDTWSNIKENEALIRLGRGAGFNSTTFNLVNSNEKVGTRVTADKLPVGWAKITCPDLIV